MLKNVKICRFIYAFQTFGVYRVNVLISKNLLMAFRLYHYVEKEPLYYLTMPPISSKKNHIY